MLFCPLCEAVRYSHRQPYSRARSWSARRARCTAPLPAIPEHTELGPWAPGHVPHDSGIGLQDDADPLGGPLPLAPKPRPRAPYHFSYPQRHKPKPVRPEYTGQDSWAALEAWQRYIDRSEPLSQNGHLRDWHAEAMRRRPPWAYPVDRLEEAIDTLARLWCRQPPT